MAAEILHLPSSTITIDPEPGSDASEAVQLLMQAHGGMLYGLGRRFCGNEDDAADLVQETMLEAFRSWHTFRGDFEIPAGVLTDRYQAVFASLDLTQDLCHAIGPDDLPESVSSRVQDAMASEA